MVTTYDQLKTRFDYLTAEDQGRTMAAVATYGYRIAAHDWFAEQAEDPDLMRRRGLRPGQPLPPEFGLFTPDGRLPDQLPRTGVARLRAWLADDDAVLRWVFPGGLTQEDEAHLRGQLHTLHHHARPDGGRGQPWSPLAAIAAVLADWPAEEPTRDISLATAERELLAVIEPLLAAADQGDRGGSTPAGD